MPGRKFSSGSAYRYGFNGQENGDEIAAGLTTAMYWEYDSRIGRRWNLDPVQGVDESPYLCFNGNPILYSDVLGDEAESDGGKKKKKSQPVPSSIPALQIKQQRLVSMSTVVVVKSLMNLSTTKAKIIPQNASSQSYFSQGHPETAYEADIRQDMHMQQSMRNAVMDPFAATVVSQWGTTASGIVNGTINGVKNHSEGIYWGIKNGDNWKVFWNSAGLALDVIPVLKIAGGARVADGLLALGNDVAITENFANRVAKKNWFDVIVHGTKDGLAFKVGGNIIKPQELYNNMLANGYKAGTNIRLISCYSGSLENGAASQLSKLSNAMVVAPTDATFIGNGQIFQAGKTMVSNGGNYKVFKP